MSTELPPSSKRKCEASSVGSTPGMQLMAFTAAFAEHAFNTRRNVHDDLLDEHREPTTAEDF